MVLFFVGSACQILIDLFIMYIMLHLFVVYDIIAKVVSEVFVISFGFIFRKFIVFKR
jgi:putative flippase GtrA